MTDLEYQEHIRHTHNAYCKVVIRHAAIDIAVRLRKQWEKELSLEYLMYEKFAPFSTTDEYFKELEPCGEYPFTVCGQTAILENGKPTEKSAAPDNDKQADKAKEAVKPRRGRPPKAGKAAPDRAKPQPRDKMSQSKPPTGKGSPAKTEAPAVTEQPSAPRNATRGVKEEVIYLNLFELHPFKNHPFGVRDDAEMQGLVESVKTAYVN